MCDLEGFWIYDVGMVCRVWCSKGLGDLVIERLEAMKWLKGLAIAGLEGFERVEGFEWFGRG